VDGTRRLRNSGAAGFEGRKHAEAKSGTVRLVSDHAISDYGAFLERKAQLEGEHGFESEWLPDFLFPFQRALVEWAVRKGRAALFADCGLGKTPMQLVWAENVRRHTGRPVLIVTPLAVSFQTVAEAEKFGIDAAVSRDGTVAAPITVTNYERLHLFDEDDFAGVVCDESSAIKAFDGTRRAIVTAFMRKMHYRLLCTATAAPNDYIELGTSSEALGYLGHMDMLGRFFTNRMGNSTATNGGYRGFSAPREWKGPEWRFKGHAEDHFWRWISSWARAMRRPSDLGFDDTGFDLPDLNYREHVVEARERHPERLFDMPANGLHEEREEQRRTVAERCEMVAALAEEHDVSIAWCNLNDEGDRLERLIPNSVQVKGSDSDAYKELAAQWFTGDVCICNRPEFRAKLATWERGERGTGRTTTPSTASNGSPSPAPINSAMQKGAAPTCATGLGATESTSERTEPLLPISATPGDANGTQPIPSTESKRRQRHVASTHENGAMVGYEQSSALASTSTRPSSSVKGAAAPSVGEPLGSTSTIATTRAESEESSAPSATSGSGSSPTTPSVSHERSCICGHESGRRRLIAKAKMFGLGMNFQHCAHMSFFPSHSYEQYYQAVRRSWRFGQKRDVLVDIVTTEGGANALANLQRKAAQADAMFEALTAHMHDALAIRRSDPFDREMEAPAWLMS